MFVRKRDIFRSRWKALIWAAGVMMTAYCSIPSPDQSAQHKTAKSAPAHHVDPWALKSDEPS